METAIETTRDLGGALLQVEGRGGHTTSAYRSAMEAFLGSGHPATVDGFLLHIEELRRTRSASVVNQAIAAGRLAFRQAAERLGLPAREVAMIRGALADVRPVRIGPPEVETVTPAERELLLGALPLRIRLVAEALYMTGARVSELLGVTRAAVKVNGVVELRVLGKGQKERVVKLARSLFYAIVDCYHGADSAADWTGFLFQTSTGAAFGRSYISREIGRAAKRVLGRSISAHVLRHSRATDLLADTGRIKAVSRMLGHADEATTLRYYVKDAFTDEELLGKVVRQ